MLLLYAVQYIPCSTFPNSLHCAVHSLFHSTTFCTMQCIIHILQQLIWFVVLYFTISHSHSECSLFYTALICLLDCTLPIPHDLILYVGLYIPYSDYPTLNSLQYITHCLPKVFQQLLVAHLFEIKYFLKVLSNSVISHPICCVHKVFCT